VHGTAGRGEKSAIAKLKDHDVIEIRRLKAQGLTETEISRKFNVNRAQIGRIARRENWAHL
jgi:DNA invertase Pin-like site-specific DNA recombinase